MRRKALRLLLRALRGQLSLITSLTQSRAQHEIAWAAGPPCEETASDRNIYQSVFPAKAGIQIAVVVLRKKDGSPLSRG
jgi:hypothetical protein